MCKIRWVKIVPREWREAYEAEKDILSRGEHDNVQDRQGEEGKDEKAT